LEHQLGNTNDRMALFAILISLAFYLYKSWNYL